MPSLIHNTTRLYSLIQNMLFWVSLSLRIVDSLKIPANRQSRTHSQEVEVLCKNIISQELDEEERQWCNLCVEMLLVRMYEYLACHRYVTPAPSFPDSSDTRHAHLQLMLRLQARLRHLNKQQCPRLSQVHKIKLQVTLMRNVVTTSSSKSI